LVFGHRGARGEAPENTLDGFAYAVARGVTAIELDVRLTADGRLAVIHDATVDRTTSAAGPVSSFTAAQLAELDARANHPSWPRPVGVPLLEQVLAAYAAKVRLAIEVKSDAPETLERVCAALIDMLERHAPPKVTVTSFDPVALEIVRRLAPDVPRAYIGRYDTPDYLDTALSLGCRQADIPLRSGSAQTVAQARAAGLRVVGWLGNDEDDLAALLLWEVDAITTDYPSRILTVLTSRGVATNDPWN